MEIFPAFLVITCLLAPLAGVGAASSLYLVYVQGWRGAWYAVPCLLAGCAAFVVNDLAFVYLIAPGC